MKVSALFVMLALTAAPLRADDAKRTQLENKIDVLTQEIERLKLGSAVEESEAPKSALGFAPAASKVYEKSPRKISIGGYGEMVYNNFRGRRQNNAVAATAQGTDGNTYS